MFPVRFIAWMVNYIMYRSLITEAYPLAFFFFSCYARVAMCVCVERMQPGSSLFTFVFIPMFDRSSVWWRRAYKVYLHHVGYRWIPPPKLA